MTKINNLLMTKTAEKPYPLGPPLPKKPKKGSGPPPPPPPPSVDVVGGIS